MKRYFVRRPPGASADPIADPVVDSWARGVANRRATKILDW
jgi:hypothetical protein